MPRPRLLAGPVDHVEDGDRCRVWWLECPGCENAIMADADQIQGRVSLDCPLCSYHETHDLTGAAAAGDLPF